jgi:hypothetical protein
MREFTEQEIKQISKDLGWSEEQVRKGYDKFEVYSSSTVIDRAIVIEAIADVEKFDSDWEACRQAEKDGIEFINDVDGLEKGCYIDTPENRKHCIEMLNKYPEYRIESLMKENPENEYWKTYRKYFGTK